MDLEVAAVILRALDLIGKFIGMKQVDDRFSSSPRFRIERTEEQLHELQPKDIEGAGDKWDGQGRDGNF